MSGTQDALYIHFEDILNPNKAGIINKINGQKEAFGKLNYRMHIVSFRTKHNLYLDDTCVLKIPSRILIFRYFIFRKIDRIIASSGFAFIYIRYFGSDLYFIRFLRKISQAGGKVFLEFPTYPYDRELRPKNLLEKYIFFLDRIYRKKLEKYIYRAISFTFDGSILSMSTIKLENGISMDSVPLTPGSDDSSSLHLIGVANVSPWHGYDRILQGLHAYNRQENRKKVTFTLVGNGNSLPELKLLCTRLGLDEDVIFAGSKAGQALDEEFKNAHLAIGSLAMHRIGLQKGSVLKLGEYTARGFPVVIAYDDFSLREDVPFVLKIPADDSPVDINRLIEFYDHCRVSPKEIRAYASAHFSWDKKVEKVINAL